MEISRSKAGFSMTCAEKVRSEEYREILIDYEVSETDIAAAIDDYCRVPVDSDISILYFRTPRSVNEPVDLSFYPYYSVPKCYGLMQQEAGTAGQAFDSLALAEAGILQVQREPLSLTGRGVTIGFVDTGIRYTQDVFRDALGNTRIASIWDQTIESGEPPEGFLYGTEYSREQINEALSGNMPRAIVPSWDMEGHGTATASVAAGSRLEEGRSFLGAAPDADIVVVKLREAKQYLREYYLLPDGARAYAETDVIMAVKYLEQYAVALERPMIICLGLGTSYGSHTGESVLDRYLDRIAGRRSRVIISCGGNEGNAAHHTQNIATAQPQEIELRVGQNERGFLLSFWSEGPGRYSLSLRTPGGEVASNIADRSGRREEYRFVFDRTALLVNNVFLEEASGWRLVLFRFIGPTAGVWTFSVAAEPLISGGVYHMWLPITEFLSSETYFLRPDPEVTLTAPSTAQGVITVNAYNDENGAFYERSGRGFTADRRIKPEFAAPGVDIPTSLGRRTGSSLSAAIMAGGAAQMMQWAVVERNYPLATGRELKYYLSLGAVRESGIRYPSREWGLGRINLQRTFQELAGLT